MDSKLLTGAREYFPQAEVLKPRRDVVHIETHLSNITRKFAAKTFEAMLREEGKQVSDGLALAGYRVLILGFDDFNVVWDMRYRRQFLVLDPPEFTDWSMRTFGHVLNYSEAQRVTR